MSERYYDYDVCVERLQRFQQSLATHISRDYLGNAKGKFLPSCHTCFNKQALIRTVQADIALAYQKKG